MAVDSQSVPAVAAAAAVQNKTPTDSASGSTPSRMRMFTTTVQEGKIEKYIDYHNNIFPEVARGLREHGKVRRLEIQRLGNSNTLMMCIETDADGGLLWNIGAPVLCIFSEISDEPLD